VIDHSRIITTPGGPQISAYCAADLHSTSAPWPASPSERFCRTKHTGPYRRRSRQPLAHPPFCAFLHAITNMPHPTKLSDFDPTWCQTLINSPSTETIPWPTLPDANTTSTSLPFSLFTQTLNTPATIRASHALWDSHGPVEFSESGQAMLLVSLGGGMNYFPNTLHGGMVAALIDGTPPTVSRHSLRLLNPSAMA
jgi:hypothetical protein